MLALFVTLVNMPNWFGVLTKGGKKKKTPPRLHVGESASTNHVASADFDACLELSCRVLRLLAGPVVVVQAFVNAWEPDTSPNGAGRLFIYYYLLLLAKTTRRCSGFWGSGGICVTARPHRGSQVSKPREIFPQTPARSRVGGGKGSWRDYLWLSSKFTSELLRVRVLFRFEYFPDGRQTFPL